MKRIVGVFIITFSLLPACKNDTGMETRETIPVWLQAKIDSMMTEKSFTGSRVYRCTWRGGYIYHVEIPISSCAYCELYDAGGKKISMSSDALRDFISSRSEITLLWKWPGSPD